MTFLYFAHVPFEVLFLLFALILLAVSTLGPKRP
jgi:hypothetical protein